MAPVSWMKPSSPKRARSAFTLASSTRCWRSSVRVKSTICASSGRSPRECLSRTPAIVASGTPSLRAWPVCAPQTYTASSSRATVMAASTRTRMSSEPSKRTKAPRCARPPASSGQFSNIVNGPCSAPRLATMPSTMNWSLAATCCLLVMGVSLAMSPSSLPQPLRGEIGTLAQRAQLRPHDALLDELRARERAEAAVDAGDDAGAVTNRLRGRHDAVRDHLRMLDHVGRRVDDAGHEEDPVGQRVTPERPRLVLMPRTRQRQRQRTDLGAIHDGQQRLERHVVGV